MLCSCGTVHRPALGLGDHAGAARRPFRKPQCGSCQSGVQERGTVIAPCVPSRRSFLFGPPLVVCPWQVVWPLSRLRCSGENGAARGRRTGAGLCVCSVCVREPGPAPRPKHAGRPGSVGWLTQSLAPRGTSVPLFSPPDGTCQHFCPPPPRGSLCRGSWVQHVGLWVWQTVPGGAWGVSLERPGALSTAEPGVVTLGTS